MAYEREVLEGVHASVRDRMPEQIWLKKPMKRQGRPTTGDKIRSMVLGAAIGHGCDGYTTGSSPKLLVIS